jgi:hypothetical protein
MTPSRRTLAFTLLSLMLGAVLGLVEPGKAQAEKLPVDCSGRKSDCTTVRNCTQWVNHVCHEYTTNLWYWYY